MSYLRVLRKSGRRYHYIVESRRIGTTVRQKVLQYLGRDPDPARVKRALAYWEEEAMANRKFGARVIRLDDKVAVVKQTFKAADDPTERYKIDNRGGGHHEAHVRLANDREVARAVRAALEGTLTEAVREKARRRG
jgi:hypothetical protein